MRETAMSVDSKNQDGTKLGEFSATQPLSGIRSVGETFAVHGIGRGGYVRKEEATKGKA